MQPPSQYEDTCGHAPPSSAYIIEVLTIERYHPGEVLRAVQYFCNEHDRGGTYLTVSREPLSEEGRLGLEFALVSETLYHTCVTDLPRLTNASGCAREKVQAVLELLERQGVLGPLRGDGTRELIKRAPGYRDIPVDEEGFIPTWAKYGE